VSSLTVAVLDDHEVVLEGVWRGLDRHGLTVVAAEVSAEPYVAAVQREKPDVCVVDLRLGGQLSGLDVIGRCLQVAPRSRVAVLTSNEDPRTALAAVDAGALGYLLKDVSLDQLVQRLRSVAEGNLVLDERIALGVLRPATARLAPQDAVLLRCVADGLTNREIGAHMHLSPHTVKDYLSRLMRQLGTRTRAETVAAALEQGLLDSPHGS
jgi:DNA-binding NarL/FixJ family response regulator